MAKKTPTIATFPGPAVTGHDGATEWFWHLKAKNGEIVFSASGDGAPTKAQARARARRAKKLMAEAEFE